MRRVAQLSVLVAAVLGTAFVIAFATSNAASQGSALAPGDGPAVRPPPVPGVAAAVDPGAAAAAVESVDAQPVAAPADVAASVSLAKNDAVMRKILGPIGYSVAASQPWMSEDGTKQLGTELDLKLNSPLSGSAQLPGVRFSGDGSSYSQLMLNAAV